MLKRSRVFKIIAYSSLIAPVAFYAGVKLRGIRALSSEASSNTQKLALGPPATLQEQEGVKWLQEEEKFLEGKRLDIERKIAELRARTRNEDR